MVLVYEEEDYGVMTLAEVTRREMRKVFQENLVKEGLELELEEKQVSQSNCRYHLLNTNVFKCHYDNVLALYEMQIL
jgi:hypothetical protein